jgi:hypothetical protein
MQKMSGGIRRIHVQGGKNRIRVKWMKIWNNDRWSSTTFPLDTNIYWKCNVNRYARLPTCPGLSPPRMWASHILSLRRRALSFSSSTRSRGLLPLGTVAHVTCFTPLCFTLFKSRSRWIFYYPDPTYLKVSVIFGFLYPDMDPKFYMYTDLHIFLMPRVLGICVILVRIWIRIRGSVTLSSVGDPDPQGPHVFGLPGSGSINQKNGIWIRLRLRILPFSLKCFDRTEIMPAK